MKNPWSMINMAQLRHLTLLALVSLLASPASGESLIVDSFESGDMSATNQDGFNWGENNRTSVVTAEGVVYNNGRIDVAIPSGRDWEPKDGEHSLRFRYGAGQHWAEQRFNLGNGYEDIWLRYWVRVPINFEHGTGELSNNKFFSMWMDAYSSKGEGATVFWNFWRDSDGGSSITVAYNDGNYGPSGGQAQRKKFIRVPDDRGRWMEVVFNAKASTSADSLDGYIGFWRRWEGEQEFTQLHEVQGVNLATPAEVPNGWANGYLMGYANASYATDTEWLIDDFEVATHSLLSTSKLTAPNPPILKVE
jgi:hypothetical protein